MSSGGKFGLGVLAVFLALWILTPLSFGWALLVLIGLPVAGYMMLDSSQKRRLKGIGRKELGR
jgi:hypothetical protein